MNEQQAHIALSLCDGFGPRGYAELLPALGSARAIVEADRSTLRAAGLSATLVDSLKTVDDRAIDAVLRWGDGDDRHLLTPADDDYPALLHDLPDAPFLLYLRGDPLVLRTPQIAIIGSRNPTSGGLDNAEQFARHLAAGGLTVTSGLALGVDSAAHAGALAVRGRTLAVTGTGPDRIYPASNRQLAAKILEEGGAIVTEFPPGTPARPGHFPRRNRLISGLSAGTLVVEAGIRSGSLITARLALEQGREVFAIPGSIHNPLARGCHALIRDGAAKLVETAGDIMDELPALLGLALAEDIDDSDTRAQDSSAAGLDPEHAMVLEALGHDPVPMDILLQRTGLTAAELSSILLILELQGRVTSMPGGRYARVWHEGLK
ncbi:DNA-processing protein DprA [Methylonatrum kenyense]|uniref:DNA-processing protein DprA n=1 Tax=Methylonatrum kenyense TaxID=455253 RepID=UPI0020BE2763|nr:DNA-processing protein DprA [Methylonatrum kenyense]MCK8515314.1 DNA-processing protein DprA [Methylonatrum kenyense]